MSLLEAVRLPVTAPLAPEPAEPPVPSTCDEVTLELLGRSVSVPTDGLRRHTNHTVLVEGPEIPLRPVGTRRLVSSDVR
jgi:hypothetical protein